MADSTRPSQRPSLRPPRPRRDRRARRAAAQAKKLARRAAKEALRAELREQRARERKDLWQDARNLPNLLTFLRILMIPAVLVSRLGRLRARSEEHTSELQSHSDLVCRLLLEKKKKKKHEKQKHQCTR